MTTLPVPASSGAINFGSTDLRAGDLILPRVKVVQAQSEENDGRAKPGEFYNTLTGENYGKSLKFVPLMTFMNRLLLVRDERKDAINAALAASGVEELPTDAAGLTCRSVDMVTGNGYPGMACEACPLSEWRAAEPPLCSETWNVAAMTEVGDLVILSFSKSSAKVGKRLFSMLRLTRQAPWASFYEATTRSEKGKRGNYETPDVTRLADRPAPELITWAREWAQTLGAAGPLDVTPEAEADLESDAF